MPKFLKGSQEAKEHMRSIREKKSNSNNIKMDLDEIQPPSIVQPIKKTRGRPKKYSSIEEAKEAKKKQTLISNKRKRTKSEPQPEEGGKLNLARDFRVLGRRIKKGWESTIEKPIISTAKAIGSTLENVASKAKDYGQAVLYGRDDYPPKVRDILKKVGSSYVKSMTLKRTPVPSLLTGALSIFSLGKFGKRLERSFDELFHLFVEMTLEDGRRVLLEKNEVINMDINPKSRPKTETKLVSSAIPHLTVNEMLDSTEKYMGKGKFFGYSAKDNNCQDFIVAFFKSNNIGDESDITFIKQDTKSLFRDLPYLRKFANTITDLGATANVITTGAGMEDLKNYDMMLNHLVSHIADPKEPIDPKDYKQSKIIIDAIKREKQELKGKGIRDKNYWVQSVVFDKDKFNITQAKKWLKTNGFKSPNVDKEANTIRFRQADPNMVEDEGYTDYRTKELGNSGINLIIAYKPKNKIKPNNIDMEGGRLVVHHIHHIYQPDSSDSDSDSSDSDMEGGRINIGNVFKKLGRDIKRGFTKEITNPLKSKVINPAEKAIVPIAKQAGRYITSKKGGLATDLIDYGIPAVTSATLGSLGTLTGSPALGVLASAVGDKLGSELIAPQLHKVSGAGAKKFVKGSREAKEHMAKIRSMKGKGLKPAVITGKVY